MNGCSYFPRLDSPGLAATGGARYHRFTVKSAGTDRDFGPQSVNAHRGRYPAAVALLMGAALMVKRLMRRSHPQRRRSRAAEDELRRRGEGRHPRLPGTEHPELRHDELGQEPHSSTPRPGPDQRWTRTWGRGNWGRGRAKALAETGSGSCAVLLARSVMSRRMAGACQRHRWYRVGAGTPVIV